jgi:hypothetical protein
MKISFFCPLLVLKTQNARHLLQSSNAYDKIKVDYNDLLHMIIFIEDTLYENCTEIGEAPEDLDNFLWALVGQCEFIGSDASIERLQFLFNLKDMVLVDDNGAWPVNKHKFCSQPQCQSIKTTQDFHEFIVYLRDVLLLHDATQYLDLSGGNLIQQQDEPVAGCSHWPDNPRKSNLRQLQESSSDEDNVNVILDLSKPREVPEPRENIAPPPLQFENEKAGEMGPSGGSTSGTPETREDVRVESESHQSPATEEVAGNTFEETDSVQFEATPEVSFNCFLILILNKHVSLGVINRNLLENL